MRSMAAACIAAVLVAGCSSSDNGGDGGGGAPSCTIHFTGGPVADPSLACSVAAVFATSTNTSGVSISGSASGLDVQFAMVNHGDLGTGDFSNTTPQVSGSLTIQTGGHVWVVNDDGDTQDGSFTLHITNITTQTSDATGKSYIISGSLDASAPADSLSGATGTVTVHATFTAGTD